VRYTSCRPDSFEQYATHLPSGENFGDPSSNLVCTSGLGRRSPSKDKEKMSPPASEVRCVKSNVRPSGDQDSGFCMGPSTLVNLSSPPLRSAVVHHNDNGVVRPERKVTRSPFGVQIGQCV